MRAPGRSVAVTLLAAALVTPSVPALAGPRHADSPGQGTTRHAGQHKVTPKPKPHKAETVEHALVHWINVQRQQRGLRPLAPAGQLTRVAHRHTHDMVARGNVWHDGAVGKEVTGWVRLGEDVGKAGSLASMEKALLDTPANRVNILGPEFRDIGVGAGKRNGSLYVTVLVRQPAPLKHH